MNLNDLKPAWRQFRLVNSMQAIDKEEILIMLEQAEANGLNKIHRYLINSFLFTVIIICCQAG